MKRGTIEHVKMHRLAERLGIPRFAAVGIMESLWHMTAAKAPSGDISNLELEDIAFYVRWDREPSELIEALIACRWLDRDGDHLLVHDWQEHAEDSVKKWLTRKGLKFADKSENVQTCLDMSTSRARIALAVAVASAKAKAKAKEKKQTSSAKADEPTGFTDFWKAYPRKVGKAVARKAWIKAKAKPPLDKILATVKDQCESDDWKRDGGQFIPHPATWINGERWADELFKPPTMADYHPPGATGDASGGLTIEEVLEENDQLGRDLDKAQAACAAMQRYVTVECESCEYWGKYTDIPCEQCNDDYSLWKQARNPGQPILDENKRLERENATLYTFAEWALDEAHKHVSEVNGSPDTFAGQVLGKADAALAAKEAKP